ncbi:hypothetical protein MCHI_001347, partial [Candidatus Magnetoovum chiemensis]
SKGLPKNRLLYKILETVRVNNRGLKNLFPEKVRYFVYDKLSK